MSFLRRFSSLFGLILLSVTLSLISPNFLTLENWLSVLRQGAALFLVSIAMTYCIISGGIDLSVGSIMALSGCVSAILMAAGWNWVLACGIGLALGLALGWLMGFCIAQFKLQAFIVSLVVMVFARGMALVLTNGVPVFGFPEDFRFLGTGFVLGVPFPVILAVIFLLVANFILRKTRFGVNVYAVGGNMEAAQFSGINVNRTLWWVYALSGTLSAFAGIVMTSRLNSCQPILAEGIELDAIAAVVIGGTAMSGGQGGLGGTVIGTLIIILLRNGLNLLGVSAFWQKVVIGIVILIAVLVDRFRHNIAGLGSREKAKRAAAAQS
ncbi:MAG TPA: ABC transporter permease [Thermodesulfobacteriota bacterium]|nr:ABC transporter permease [Thermodesulfobacteriota bacterium]